MQQSLPSIQIEINFQIALQLMVQHCRSISISMVNCDNVSFLLLYSMLSCLLPKSVPAKIYIGHSSDKVYFMNAIINHMKYTM